MKACFRYDCPYLNQSTMQCNVTVCTIQNQQYNYDKSSVIIFPHTIGDRTFKSASELYKWVISQQRKNRELLNVLLRED